MALLGATAAIPTAALAAAMPTLDPIYAAIERHRIEQKSYVDALIARDKLHEIVRRKSGAARACSSA